MNRLISVAVVSLLFVAASAANAQTTIFGGNAFTQTWTLAGSPFIVQGDVTVPAGQTLTIQAGVEILFASVDALFSGNDPNEVELIIAGSLVVEGTAAEPVVMRAQSGTARNSYFGVWAAPSATTIDLNHLEMRHAKAGLNIGDGDATVTVDGLTIEDSSRGLEVLGGSSVFNDVTVRNCSGSAVHVRGGTPVFNRLLAQNTVRGVLVDAPGSVELHNALIWEQAVGGVEANMGPTSSGQVLILHSTIAFSNIGVELSAAPATVHALVVRNSILAYNGVGAQNTSPNGQFEMVSSNFFANMTPQAGAIDGIGNLAVDPLFVDGPAGDFHLTVGSPMIDSATDVGALLEDHDGTLRPQDGDGVDGPGFDIGAFEFVLIPGCGNTVIEDLEECDDGNQEDGDGCSADCLDEVEDAGVLDAGVGPVDAGEDDAGAAPLDAGEGDAGAGPVDAGAGPVDAGDIDAGDGEGDAGNGEVDAGDSDVDAGDSEDDAGDGDIDAGDSEEDAGDGDIDAGDSKDDAGDGNIDAGDGDIDAGADDVDAGADDVDAGDTDAGTIGVDAGEGSRDAGADDEMPGGCSATTVRMTSTTSGGLALFFLFGLMIRRRRPSVRRESSRAS